MSATRVALVAAHDEDLGIGRSGTIPWHVPADFALFRRLTMGHVLLMGRHTLASLPPRGLPGRRIVCVTSSASLPGAEACLPGIDEALAHARCLAGPGGRVFVAGGAGLYEGYAPIADEAYVTRIPGRHGCDRFFPDLGRLGWIRAGGMDAEGLDAARWVPPRP